MVVCLVLLALWLAAITLYLWRFTVTPDELTAKLVSYDARFQTLDANIKALKALIVPGVAVTQAMVDAVAKLDADFTQAEADVAPPSGP